jgi:CheY-like chemotaxis protein
LLLLAGAPADPARLSAAPLVRLVRPGDDGVAPVPATAAASVETLVKPMVRLPLLRVLARALGVADTEPLPDPPTPERPLAGRRVLMVEDNAFNRDILRAMLHRLGIGVDEAVDGPEALECFRIGSPYDAVLMDLHLPGMDGFACARRLRELPNGAVLPILAVTANVLSTTAGECLAAGMNDHLAKPIEPETLRRALVGWILGPRPEAGFDGAGGMGGAQRAVLPGAADTPSPQPFDGLPGPLPGLDLAQAAIWSAGSAAALHQLLQRMDDEVGQSLQRIERLIAVGQLAGAAGLTHDLSGIAVTVGAVDLTRAARMLDVELRAGRAASPLARAALDQLGAQFALLGKARALLGQHLAQAAPH